MPVTSAQVDADRSLQNTLRHLTSHGAGGIVEERGGLLLFAGACETAHPYVNGVVRIDGSISPPEIVGVARELFAPMNRAFGLWASAHGDEDIATYARRLGLYSHRPEGSPGMMLASDRGVTQPGKGLVLRAVESIAEHTAFVHVTEQAYEHAMTAEVTRAVFGDPAIVRDEHARAFVVYEDEVPVAAAMVTVYGGLGELGFVGTVPGARGRGLGLMVSAACAHEGFERGAKSVFLQASALGEPVYRRLGFVEITRYTKFEVEV